MKCNYYKLSYIINNMKEHKLSYGITNLEDMMYPFKNIKTQKDNNNIFDIFNTTWEFIPNKRKYLFFLLISEIIGTLGVIGLILESKLIIITAPLISIIISICRDKYFVEQGYKTKKEFRKLVYDYFDNLSYAEKKSCENMNEFDGMVERSGQIICSIMDSGIPSIIKMIISSLSCLIVFYTKGYMTMLPLIIGIYFGFYKSYIKKKQSELVIIRTNKRENNKKIVPIKRWISHLFQNHKRSVDELLLNSYNMDVLDEKFTLEWIYVRQIINLISIFISSLGLFMVKDFVTLLIIKVVFDNFTCVISMISHFTTNLTNNMMDFDRFLVWYHESNGREKSFINSSISFPIEVSSVIIKYKNFSLHSNPLIINECDKILLKGQTGAGKTQFVNALQGLVNGAVIKGISDPRTIQNAFEYMNQQTREAIPCNGLSLRDLLEGESDNLLIESLLQLVMLENRFPNIASYDIKVTGLSGGERMRLSLVFTLLETIKKKKQILILDEPEQGLDESTRRQVITNILNYLKIPVICIYHGSTLDLLKMPFNKIWMFDHANTHTEVIITDFINYKKKIIDDIKIILI